ncbi:MAG: hypothetical protein E6G49_12100 [Actinobacteria bacterium]|nr:MAG: hypothetical protein E6G49_12100 [Actinomycetota bacterium]
MPSFRGLKPLPPDFATTGAALHRVAEEIVAPARKPENEIALRATPGGFGTPAFEFEGRECQVKMEGDQLVYRKGHDERRTRITSLAAAGALVEELLPAGANLDDHPLEVERAAAEALAAWCALGASVLEVLVAEADPGDDASEVNLWPEHFDIAIELGPDADGTRANYGFSPGDDEHAEPYLYVGPWTAEVAGELWNATGFRGAELGYAGLLAADDPYATALEFCETRKQALRG